MSELAPIRKPPGAGVPPPPAPPLTRRQKAAVVIHLLVSGGADPGLRSLSPIQQRDLVEEMARLRFVDHRALAEVVAEFAAELDSVGLHFPRDTAHVLAALDGTLSLEVVEQFAAELGDGALAGDGPWREIAGLAPEEILAIMEGESDEVNAILLSKMTPARAASLLGLLPEERADAIAAAFARTEDATPAAVARIGSALGRLAGERRVPAFASEPVRRVGDILNAATSGLRRGPLERMDRTDAGFAARVRAEVFSFENIPARVSPRDVPKVLRGVDAGRLAIALKGVPPHMEVVRDFLLAALSNRMADQVRDGMEEAQQPTAEDAEAAMAEVVAEIRRMEEAGELILLAPGG